MKPSLSLTPKSFQNTFRVSFLNFVLTRYRGHSFLSGTIVIPRLSLSTRSIKMLLFKTGSLGNSATVLQRQIANQGPWSSCK